MYIVGDLMIKANSTVKLNFGRIKELSQATVTAIEQTAVALQAEIRDTQVIPYDKGRLQGEAFFVDSSNVQNGLALLVQEGPYARKLYYHPEYDFRKDENPNAKGKWFEDWEPGGSRSRFAPEAFKKFYKEAGGV